MKRLLLFFSLGFFSLLSQTLILREFIISFNGNELGIGLFYFFWLFWVGIGALIASTALKKLLTKHFLKCLTLYPLLAFGQIFLFISLRRLAGVSWWEFFALEKVFFYLFIFSAFISLATGIIFTLAVFWFKCKKDESNSAIISSSYIAEGLGSFSAGCIVTLLITKLLTPLFILILGSLFFSLIILLISFKAKRKSSIILNLIISLAFLILIFNYSGINNFSRYLRQKNLLPSGQIIEEIYTPYQHLILGKLGSQTVSLSNGEIISSMPELVDADKESAALMAMANKPKNILIFGYGVENLIHSLLKFSIGNITYCLEDKTYYEAINRHLSSNQITEKLNKSLQDARLNVVFESPQLFLKQNTDKFDLIIIHTPDPASLALNRFFTKEFYALAQKNLNQTGVITTRITSAENYIGEEIRNYGSSIYYTLKEIFPKIIIMPGKINWFFAGRGDSYLTDNPLILKKRLEKILPDNFSFSPQGFSSLFIEERLKFIKGVYIENALFKNQKLLNQDSRPLTFFTNLLVMARYSNSWLTTIFKNTLLAGILVFILPFLIFFIFRIKFILNIESIKTKRLVFNAKLFQFFSGFLGLSFHLILIFLFQNRFGLIFQFIGLVNALFMLGLALGGLLGKQNTKNTLKIIITTLTAQAILILACYPVFGLSTLNNSSIFFLFLIFFLGSGTLAGISYPLSAKILQNNNLPLVNTAASLELLDHWGGALAGLILSLFMLPLIGITKTLFILAGIAILLIILFALELSSFKFVSKEKGAVKLSFPYIRTSYIITAIALCFIINTYLLEKKKTRWQDKHPELLKMIQGDCNWQNTPFPAYACSVNQKKEYVLESKHFAPKARGMFGPINLIIKTDSQGTIKEIQAGQHREAPAYVRNLPKFLKQFKGLSLSSQFKFGADLDAITGATVTSHAVRDILTETLAKLNKSPPSPKSTQKFKVDASSLCLIIFTLMALILYIFYPGSLKLRKIYLFLNVIVLGFIFNITFSVFHLANLLTLNLPSLKFLSQILIYGLILLLGIFFGQFWCGWLCPLGALQEIIGKRACSPSKSLDKKARYFKYLFLVFFIAVVSIKGGAFLFKQEPLVVFFLNPTLIFNDKLFSFVIIFFSLFFLRFWCRYFCICGAFLSLFNKFAVFKKYFSKKYKECPWGVQGSYDLDCIHCNLCMKNENK